MTITINTLLSEGIARSFGGGETRVHYEYATGPRNLLKAIKKLREHAKEMTEGSGNIGHIGSWIEIDGVPINDGSLLDIEFDKKRGSITYKSHMQRARELIEWVKEGGYKSSFYEYDDNEFNDIYKAVDYKSLKEMKIKHGFNY